MFYNIDWFLSMLHEDHDHDEDHYDDDYDSFDSLNIINIFNSSFQCIRIKNHQKVYEKLSHYQQANIIIIIIMFIIATMPVHYY